MGDETFKEISTDLVEITTKTTIDLKPIKEQINAIDSLLAQFPSLKTKADAETLAFWNDKMVNNNSDKIDLLERKKNLQEIIKRYEIK